MLSCSRMHRCALLAPTAAAPLPSFGRGPACQAAPPVSYLRRKGGRLLSHACREAVMLVLQALLGKVHTLLEVQQAPPAAATSAAALGKARPQRRPEPELSSSAVEQQGEASPAAEGVAGGGVPGSTGPRGEEEVKLQLQEGEDGGVHFQLVLSGAGQQGAATAAGGAAEGAAAAMGEAAAVAGAEAAQPQTAALVGQHGYSAPVVRPGALVDGAARGAIKLPGFSCCLCVARGVCREARSLVSASQDVSDPPHSPRAL